MISLIRIGARGSKLSLAQTELTRLRLAQHLGADLSALEIIPIVTSGDVKGHSASADKSGASATSRSV